MPQCAVLIYTTDSAHEPGRESPEKAECDSHAERLTDEGAMTFAWAFTPKAHAKSVRADGISDGPFLPGEVSVAGIYVLAAPTLEDAVAVASRNPAVRGQGGVEVRPVHSGGPVA